MGGKCVLGGQTYPGWGMTFTWSAPDAGVGAPTPRSVPKPCRISGADEGHYRCLVDVLWQTVKEIQRTHQLQIALLRRQFNESIISLQESFVRSCTSQVGGGTVKSPRTHPCVLCHKLGHWKRRCYLNKENVSKGRPDHVRRSRPSPSTHPCFVCRQLGHWKVECPRRNRKSNRSDCLDDQVNGQDSVGETHKPTVIMSEVGNFESKAIECERREMEEGQGNAPSGRSRRHVLTPGTRARRQAVRRPGGLVPPACVFSGDSSDSDDDGETEVVDVAAQPGVVNNEETASQNANDVAETASDAGEVENPQDGEQAGGTIQPGNVGGDEVAQQAVPGQAKDEATGVLTHPESEVPAQAEDDVTAVLVQSEGEVSDGEVTPQLQPEHPIPVNASDSEDGEDNSLAPRRSTRSRQPPDRFGFSSNTVSSFTSNRRNTVSAHNVPSPHIYQSSIAKVTQGPGIRESPTTAGQVTPPLTEEQQGVCKGSKASDWSIGSWFGSIFRFARKKRRASAQTKGN
ncbi:Hypp5054 [Branchiostoma lanceolatum]|uniref:Hypp5054 protein n=1 Tax=Branchiostoma lanceolatum TaxID=7740 RepID=A0A8K0AES7_BRALA|nr:Hypp5054 [Branchiostoma lanceolatum]